MGGVATSPSRHDRPLSSSLRSRASWRVLTGVFPLRCLRIFILAVLPWAGVWADGPKDNLPDNVRPVPPPGIEVPDDVRRELTDAAETLRQKIDATREGLTNRPTLRALLPDVEVLHKAVDWALRYNEFFRTNEFADARDLLERGHVRLKELGDGRPEWPSKPGPGIAGYRSRIDDSVQPFGLVVPAGYRPDSGRRWRLDFWFHGRGETLSELAFLSDRRRNRGEFAPDDAFVLHLYGRYCNGSRFAGETDFWEALDEVRRRYPIDEDRMVVRGFSLGGASCWHFAVHHAWRWAAAAPGAGFSETAEFLNVFQGEKLAPALWEQKLWRLHDATAHAINVGMVPLVAYSGEDDRQIQAARAMERAMTAEGLRLAHIIGPKTGHKYEPGAKREIDRRIDALAVRGRESVPREVRFVTHSLRYSRIAWVTLDGLSEHWEPARVDAVLGDSGGIEVTTRGVAALTLVFETGQWPFAVTRPAEVRIDGQRIGAPVPESDRSWKLSVHRTTQGWNAGPRPEDGLRKVPGLQGPIDDAFMDSFVFVRPTGAPMNPTVGGWVTNELARGVREWRRHYRGDVRILDDSAVGDADIAAHNLVLWGDPQSNAVLARIADRLPIRWTADQVVAGGKAFRAADHVPVLIFPNPLNPRRYVVVNSGFTFREYDYLNNARQTPKLPDWAVIDLGQPANARTPGRIAEAGFFDETWRLP
jgi:hypothetical protein